ncbi:cytochrome c3 family protein [Thermosulfuriphilus sp.]
MFFPFSLAFARVSGICSNCHTMHYSQGGTALSQWGSSGPYKALLTNDCLGCHTGLNNGANKTPYVLSTSAPTYGNTGTEANTNTLAGGNFYWVSIDDACGHNVAGVAGVDATLGTTPPGGTDLGQQLSCAGQYGCHGDRTVASDVESLLGAHHTDDSTIDGTTVGKSYRFLKGIVGYEDSDWEYQPTAVAHNQYKGRDRTAETDVDSTTISALCGQCHGDFHAGTNISNGTWGSPWLRHPTDYDLGNTSLNSEYRNYPGNYGSGVGTYSVIAPVASEDVSTVKSTVNFNKDTIVTCISCHRAHGTPYKKILRWNYQGWPGGTSINGCNACHTAKD